MRFEFATATRIVFGAGSLQEIGAIARSFGCRALLVTGSQPERAARLATLLNQAGVEAFPFAVSKEPEIGTVEDGVRHARANQCDLVISFGGGSVIDAGKAIAAMLTNPGPVLDYLEVVGRNQPLSISPAPFIALPTTAGTGTEVTRNAVLASLAHQVKVSLRSPLMLPRVALVDPRLTLDLPPAITAASGLDALTQLIEPYLSCRANPMTDALCVEGMQRAARSLRRVVEAGHDLEAREDMALASLWSGMALANAGLGAVHGFAGPIGGKFPAPHGAVCAALLPHVTAVNLRALQQRQPDSELLVRFDAVARLLTGRPTAVAEDGVRWLESLVSDLQIPGLGSYGITPVHADELVQKATASSSMKGNPLPLTADELKQALLAALGE
jgi:alcohol dehydrogenase class IV